MNGSSIDLNNIKCDSSTIASNPLAWIKHKYPQSVSAISKRFFKSFEQAQRTLTGLAALNILKRVHYPLTINQILHYMIEERVQVLLKNHPDAKQIERDWQDIKMLMAANSENLFKINIQGPLNNFIDNLCIKLSEVDIDTAQFRDNISKIISILDNSHIGDIPLSFFFEHTLQNRIKEVASFYLPASSIHQSLELIIHNTKSSLAWLKPFIEGELLEISHTLDDADFKRDVATSGCKDLQMSYVFLKSRCQEIPVFLQKIEQLINRLENFSAVADNSEAYEALKQETLQICLEADDLLVSMVTSNFVLPASRASSAKLLSFMEDYNRIRLSASAYITGSFGKIFQLTSCFKEAKVAMRGLPGQELRAYLSAQLPIPVPQKSAVIQKPNTVSSASPGRKKKSASHNKKGKAKGKGQDSEKEASKARTEAPSLKGKEKSSASADISSETALGSVLETLESSVRSIDQFEQESWKLIAIARQRKTREAERACLVNASWHLNKLSFAKKMLEDGVPPEERLNVLTAISIHASLAMEQLYQYRLKKNHIEDEAVLHTHNLKFLHRALFGNNRFPPAVRRLYLALFWTRFSHKEYHDWQRLVTFQQAQIPDLLETLVCLSENPESLSATAFQKYCSDLLREVATYLPVLTNSQGPSSGRSVEVLAEEPVEFEAKTCKPVLAKMSELADRVKGSSYDSMPSLMIAQSLDSIKMLERTLRRLPQSKSSDEFCFLAYRALFLMQESAERSLHALDYLKRGQTETEQHEIEALAALVGLELTELSSALSKISLKLKYPFVSNSKGLGAQLIDSTVSLGLHPELEKGFEVADSPIPFWNLPLKEVNRKLIDDSLQQILQIWTDSFEQTILPAFDKELTARSLSL